MFRKSTVSKLVLIALSMVVVSPLPALAQTATDSTGGASCPAPGGEQGDGGGRGGRRGHRGMRGGKGGNVDPARREAMKAKMMAKFDKNGDGQLDDNEKASLQQFRQERKARRAAMQNGSNPGSDGPGAVPPPGAQ
jgi:hypothetical protein